MRRFTLLAFLAIFLYQPVFAGINAEKVIMDHNKKIKKTGARK